MPIPDEIEEWRRRQLAELAAARGEAPTAFQEFVPPEPPSMWPGQGPAMGEAPSTFEEFLRGIGQAWATTQGAAQAATKAGVGVAAGVPAQLLRNLAPILKGMEFIGRIPEPVFELGWQAIGRPSPLEMEGATLREKFEARPSAEQILPWAGFQGPLAAERLLLPAQTAAARAAAGQAARQVAGRALIVAGKPAAAIRTEFTARPLPTGAAEAAKQKFYRIAYGSETGGVPKTVEVPDAKPFEVGGFQFFTYADRIKGKPVYWNVVEVSSGGLLRGNLRTRAEGIEATKVNIQRLGKGKLQEAIDKSIATYGKPVPVTEQVTSSAEVARGQAEMGIPTTEQYVIRQEAEPLFPSGTKYVAYRSDGTPLYMAAETEDGLKARIRATRPGATFVAPGQAEMPITKPLPEAARPGIAGAQAFKPLAYSSAGSANLMQAPTGELVERIASGPKKGWWKIVSGTTEYVGKTPEGVVALARRKGGQEAVTVRPLAAVSVPETARPAVQPPVGKPMEAVGKAWETGAEYPGRPFADPNSTRNEIRHRILAPSEIEPNTYFSRPSSTPGVRYVMGKSKATGESVIQAVRVNRAQFTEPQAAQWWEANRARLGRPAAQPGPVTGVTRPPVPATAGPPPAQAAAQVRKVPVGMAAAPPPAAVIPPSPPVKPPVVPGITPPRGIPPVAQNIQDTLAQAKAIVERDRPGVVTRLIDYVPGTKQIQRGLHPSLDMPESMVSAWVGEGSARAQVGTRLRQQTIGQLDQLEQVFGKGATTRRDFKPTGVSFTGTAEQAKYPYVGTLADILARPSLYQLSTEQRAAVGAIQTARSAAFDSTKAAWNLDIGEFAVEPGSIFLPNVDISEDAIQMAGSIEAALRRGRGKERFYANAAERWAHDKTFRPETTVSRLLGASDESLASMAGRNVFMEGAGGKTRLEVMRETHPELAAKMEGLRKKLQSLRGTLGRLEESQGKVVDDFLASPLDEADLARLQADLNPKIKRPVFVKPGVPPEPDIIRLMPPTKNFGKNISDLEAEIRAVRTEIANLRPAWNVANLKPYVFVQEGIYRYFPAKEAAQVRNLVQVSHNPMLSFIDNLRATAFGGDLSPITIQGATAWFSDPVGVSRFIAQGKGNLTQAAMLADMKANPESWRRFVTATGINPLGEIEREFAVGFVGRIPKVGKFWTGWNEALYRPITKLQKDVFETSYQAALKRGLTAEQAAAIGADDATKIIPRINYRRLGQSQAQAAQQRAVLTSVSFLTQPTALMNDAVKGLVKVGLKKTVTPSESFAMKRVLTLVATTEAIAVLSAVYYAQTHNQDVGQAVKDALNPASGKFMTLTLPWGARVGLGGPFRSLIRAVTPKMIPGVPVPMPFAGLHRFAVSKLGPALGVVYDEIRNVDFYGKRIRTGTFPLNILQGLEYAVERTLPLTLGSAAQQSRQGEGLGVVGQEAASQFMGTNYQPADPVWDAKVRWDKDFKAYRDIPTNPREAAAKGLITREHYRRNNPEVDAKLFITGREQVDSTLTWKAKLAAVALMQQHGIRAEDIESLKEKEFESAAVKTRREYFQRILGEVVATPVPTFPQTKPAQDEIEAWKRRELEALTVSQEDEIANWGRREQDKLTPVPAGAR